MTTLDRIKETAKKRGYNITEVNEKAKLGKNVIYSWKTKNPSYNNLKAVADVLKVSVEYLSGESDDPNPNSKNQPKEIDLNEALKDDYTILSWKGMEVPEEEKEMIRRILNGGKE